MDFKLKSKVLKKIKALKKPRPSQLKLNYDEEVTLRQLIINGDVILDADRRLIAEKKSKTAIEDACDFLTEEWKEKTLPRINAKIRAEIQAMDDEIKAALELAMNNLAPEGEAYKACEKARKLLG